MATHLPAPLLRSESVWLSAVIKKRLTKHRHHHNHRHSSPFMCKWEAVSHTCCVVEESLQSSFVCADYDYRESAAS